MRSASVFLSLFLLGACSNRVVSALDDGAVRSDSGETPDAALVMPDSSVAPPPGCTSNADCTGTKFCYFASGCGKSGPGVCKYAPGGCTADCPGVCGCDGKTYCNACAAWKAGTSVDATGASCAKKLSCAELNTAYMAAVVQARTCCPDCRSLDGPCSLLVWHALPTGCPCPCQTYVNPDNTQALQQMKDLEQQWVAQGCGPGLPPPPDMTCCALYPACNSLEFGASCAGSGTQGTCQDNPSP